MPTLLNQSPALLAALLLLVAYGLPGVFLLKRFASDTLDRAEVWVYGIPLGVVITSLLLLAVSSIAGFSLVVVLGLAAGCIAPLVKPLITEFRGHGRAEHEAPIFGRFALIVIAAFVVRWAIFWATGYCFDDVGLQASNTGFWADWALHMGDVSSFLYGNNFPPVHPRYIGAPHSYHYLTSVTAAAMASLGGAIPFVLLLQSFVLSMLVLLGVFLFARRMTGDSRSAALTLILFFLGGTLGWVLFVRNANDAHAFWSTLYQRPWNGSEQEAGNFRWQNVFFSLLQPQRSFLYGIPLGMLILSLLEAATRVRARRLFILAGLVAGLLPFANLSTLLALALITPFLFLLFPVKEWFFFFAAWIATAAPQLWLQQAGGTGAASAMRTQIGWVAAPDPWIWFWLKNSGLFIPLLLLAIFDRHILSGHTKRFLVAFMPLFVIANVVIFQPWDWDNTKVFLFWYLAGSILIAAMLVRAWTTPLARAGVLLALLTLTASGLLANLNQILGREKILMLTREELSLAEELRVRTAPDAVFAVGLQHNHPVPMLSGRKVVMSYPGWLWSQGFDYAERERDLREIYALAPRAPELLTKYGVDYLVIGPWERREMGTSPEAFGSRYPVVLHTENYSVFDVRQP